jgi:hypothetical protein
VPLPPDCSDVGGWVDARFPEGGSPSEGFARTRARPGRPRIAPGVTPTGPGMGFVGGEGYTLPSGTFRRQPTEAGSPLPCSLPASRDAATNTPNHHLNGAASRRSTCATHPRRTAGEPSPACAEDPRRPRGGTKKKCGSLAFAACPPGLRRRGVPRDAAFEDLPLRGRYPRLGDDR